MTKLLAIARHEITLRYADPVILLLAIALPLLIAALVNLAFAHVVLGRSIPEAKVPVGIVNRDKGSQWGNLGTLFVRALTPEPAATTLPANPTGMLRDPTGMLRNLRLALFAVRGVADETEARRLVEREELVAALLIPPNFSADLAMERATVEVYFVGRENVLGVAFKNVVETLANTVSTVEITLRMTVKGLLSDPLTRTELQTGMLDDAIADLVLTAAQPESNPIQIQYIPPIVQPAQVKLAHYLAATIAIMFVSFGALVMSANLFHDKAQWTLQRTYISPTRPVIILGGQVLGIYLAGLIQMSVLVAGMAFMEQALGSSTADGIKIDLLGLTILILAVVAAATGMGAAIAGSAGTYTEATNYGRAFLVLMGLAGGFFFPVELFPQPLDLLSRVTFQYWAIAGFTKLALGGGITSILPHSLILTAMAIVFFAVGNWLLRRRIGFV